MDSRGTELRRKGEGKNLLYWSAYDMYSSCGFSLKASSDLKRARAAEICSDGGGIPLTLVIVIRAGSGGRNSNNDNRTKDEKAAKKRGRVGRKRKEEGHDIRNKKEEENGGREEKTILVPGASSGQACPIICQH
jgi:hypothetical protein